MTAATPSAVGPVPAEVSAHTGPVTSYEQLRGGAANPVTGGIWRLHGARADAVVKLLVPPRGVEGPTGWVASTEPTHWNYWRREADALTSGLSGAYAAHGVPGPRLLSAQEHDDGRIALWCEAAAESGDGVRGDEVVALAARLGAAQGEWCRRVPDLPWLSRRWLRQYVASKPLAPAPEDWSHPVAAEVWPAPLREGLRSMWERRTDWVARVESLPRTLAHLDVWPANLVGGTLLDWAFVGEGAVGEDAGNLVPDSFFDGLVPLEDLEAVTDEAPQAYAAEAATSGRMARSDALLGVHASAVAKYVWLAPFMLDRLRQDTGPWRAYAGRGEHDPREVLAARRPVLELLVRWADELG